MGLSIKLKTCDYKLCNCYASKLLITLLFVVLISFAFVKPASAQITAYVNFMPASPLPGDHVHGKLVIKTGTTATTITGIEFMSPLNVNPSSVSNVGTIPPESEYILPFTLTAPSPGVYTVEVAIFMENGTLTKTFNLNVVNAKPEVVILNSLTLGEVNIVQFTLYNPINAVNVKVIPLFKAYPSVILVSNNHGEFEFYPKVKSPLKFRIEFYDTFADNYHSYVQTVHPAYKKSNGVHLNVSVPHTVYLMCDVIPVNIQISNLRNDVINSIRLHVKTGRFNKTVFIPYLKSGESKTLLVKCPAFPEGNQQTGSQQSNKNVGVRNELIKVDFSYMDSLGNLYNGSKYIYVKVKNVKTVSISDVSVSTEYTKGVEITGDVSNSGWSKVYAVTVTAVGKKNKSYFIGTIDPSDYNTFDILTTPNASKIVVTWQNSLGQSFSSNVSLVVAHSTFNVEVKESNKPVVVSVVAAIIVLVLIIIGVKKSRSKSK